MNDDKTTSTMVKIDAEIGVASDGTWGVYCKEQPFTGAGDTPQEDKDDMMEQMQFYKKTMKGLGMKYPASTANLKWIMITTSMKSCTIMWIPGGSALPDWRK